MTVIRYPSGDAFESEARTGGWSSRHVHRFASLSSRSATRNAIAHSMFNLCTVRSEKPEHELPDTSVYLQCRTRHRPGWPAERIRDLVCQRRTRPNAPGIRDFDYRAGADGWITRCSGRINKRDEFSEQEGPTCVSVAVDDGR